MVAQKFKCSFIHSDYRIDQKTGTPIIHETDKANLFQKNNEQIPSLRKSAGKKNQFEKTKLTLSLAHLVHQFCF